MSHADRITYVGHATVLAELGGVRLLTDPVLRSRLLGVIKRQVALPGPEVSRQIDAVLISHLHHDHLDFGSLKRFGREIRIVAPAGGGRVLARRGYRNVTELSPGEATRIGAVEVRATDADHEGRRHKVGRHVPALGYELIGGGRRIYFAGDTDLFPHMDQITGDLDVALLPIAGWGPHTDRGHLDPQRAAEAARLLKPKRVIPIHWGTLLRADLGRQMPRLLNDPPREFVAQLGERAPAVAPVVLEPGESLELGPSS